MGYRTIGNTVAEWDDDQPFVFTMREEVGPSDGRTTKTITIDLTDLREGFEDAFMLHLKAHLIERRSRVILRTLKTETGNLINLFRKVIDLKLFNAKVGVIDEAFLLCLGSVKESLKPSNLEYLKKAFASSPNSHLFAKGLHISNFPRQESKKGGHGSQIDRILGKALSQAAVVHILDLCDIAYATGAIDIGHYSFAHLAFAVFCRPESYRQIRVSDLDFDKESNQYAIRIVRAKTGEHVPGKVTYCINEPLGVLLMKQRQAVIASYGHLVVKDDIEKLALFPARGLRSDKSEWLHEFANQNYGMYENSSDFHNGYSKALKKSFKDDQFTLSANALRHTVGTLLAQTGASARTIQAVLKHASQNVCRAYVDIAFAGMSQELSEAMRPAFQEHLPGLLNFRSKSDPVLLEKSIRSEDLETGRIEDAGECGKEIACENAPIVCYGCFRFRPCWDADHSVNLKVVQREIDDMSKRGKPFQHMVDRARTARNWIIIVMNAADRYRDAIRQGHSA